ncbi:hypothetical protein Clacol_006685 [Clathrus columnatus]|uniref:Retinoic acid induced 16-like protein n=1 Tax=Clathrus columnatus TaxID=1419009 RepID=A0AAV5AH34_9AGAM|nr:hypothetical protein Clacol_006685 [Clathrus columnatus]
MEYFSKFLRTSTPQQPKSEYDRVQEFHESWQIIKNTLQFPDERQLTKGISSTDVPIHIKLLVDSLVWESTRADEGTTGQCLEYLLKNDILGNLVRLSETDRPFGIQALVLRSIANLVVLLDEQFLVHSVVHKAVLRLLRNCVGDQIEEQVDGKAKLMGAASNPKRVPPSEYEEDLVDLLCILCSRIRNFRELLMIFFYDKHWYQTHLQAVMEEEEEDDDESFSNSGLLNRSTSPTPSQTTITSGQASSTRQKVEYEFLLFNYLLRFVHREGRIGDFARAGLLFLMDVAMSASDSSDVSASDSIADAALALAEYVLDGDFSDVLGAGLGAVYSVLPSKLAVRPEISQSNNGMVIGVSSFNSEKDKERKFLEDERDQSLGIENSSTIDFKARLDHFLKLLNFLKDVLRLNGTTSADLAPTSLVGTAIVQSILNAVRSVFLENILYTSILECSDIDGSAVAVMTYIDIMIHTWAGNQLGDMLVEFLMNEDEHDFHGSHIRSSGYTRREKSFIKKLRRKSSAMAFLEMEAPDARRKPSEYITSVGRFTLKDLISSNLRSSSSRSVIAALYLLQTLLTCHPTVCVDKLLVSIRDPSATNFPQPSRLLDIDTVSDTSHDSDDEVFIYPGEEHIIPPVKLFTLFKEPDMSLPIHELEMTMYHGLVSRIGSVGSQSNNSFSTGYTHYLHDALLLLQSHRAFQESFSSERPPGFSLHHRLDPNDPLLVTLLSCLQDFFCHTPEYNIALTGVLGALALDPYRSLTGWLVFTTPAKAAEDQVLSVDALGSSDDESIDGDYSGDLLNSGDYDLRALPLNEALRPVLYSVFYSLISQLDRYRSQIPDFNKYLVERRQGLLFSENLNDALALALETSEERSNLSTTFLPPPGTPRARRPTPSRNSSTTTEALPPQNKVIDASPFGSHYQKTGTISVLPHSAQLPSSGPWSPAKKPTWSTAQEILADNKNWDEEEDTFTQPFHIQKDIKDTSTSEESVTLSQLLDNIVILEESIKELTAIIYARRSLGIDGVRYVQ